MGARKHTTGVGGGQMDAATASRKNSRRYAVEAEADRQKHRREGDMFPETRVDPTVDGDQRFTTRDTDAWCRKVAGVEQWDLDVAACEESHLADYFFTKFDDGLTKSWGPFDPKLPLRVWCNPPFSDIAPWVDKAWSEALHCETIAMLLPASRTEQQWWQAFVEPFRDGRGDMLRKVRLTTHFLPGRTRFGHPGNPEGVGVGSPPFACVLLVWRCS